MRPVSYFNEYDTTASSNLKLHKTLLCGKILLIKFKYNSQAKLAPAAEVCIIIIQRRKYLDTLLQ